jgi:hypothetical protein
VSGTEADAYVKEQGAAPTHVILDEDGAIGRLYGAKTTPHMFLIDEKGTLVYAGAIDDQAVHRQGGLSTAAKELRARRVRTRRRQGKPVTTATTAPYGLLRQVLRSRG